MLPWVSRREGALGASLQCRPTSCLCLWVELYESKGSQAMLCGGPELVGLLTWQDTTLGESEVWGHAEPGWEGGGDRGVGLFW